MKIIEGTVQEIVDYQKLTGVLTDGRLSGPGFAEGGALPEDAGAGPASSRSVSQFLGDDEDSYFVRQFVYTRAPSAAATKRSWRLLSSKRHCRCTPRPTAVRSSTSTAPLWA